MKKLLCFLLSVSLLLCLVGCPASDPSDTTSTDGSTQTEPSKTEPTEPPARKLVSTYNSKGIGNLAAMWPEFMFTFSYNQTFTGGTVNLSGPEEESLSGEFTCDEKRMEAPCLSKLSMTGMTG